MEEVIVPSSFSPSLSYIYPFTRLELQNKILTLRGGYKTVESNETEVVTTGEFSWYS